MKTPLSSIPSEKIVSIVLLYCGAAAITAAGVIFSILALINGVNIPVLSAQVPGALFGVVIAFLGVRYLLSVHKLKVQVFKQSSQFSWSNFKRQKKCNAKIKLGRCK